MLRAWLCGFPCTAWLLFLIVVLPTAAVGQSCPSDEERQVLDLINAERAEVGAPALVFDARLMDSARRHSDDMAEGNFLSHTGSDGSSASQRAQDAGYPSGIGETAGAGQSNAASIVLGWMNSSGHRAILLNPSWRHIGIAYAPTSWFYRHLWTANFGAAPGAPVLLDSACGGSAPSPIPEPLGRPGQPYLVNP